jgi:hypothetical protein
MGADQRAARAPREDLKCERVSRELDYLSNITRMFLHTGRIHFDEGRGGGIDPSREFCQGERSGNRRRSW